MKGGLHEYHAECNSARTEWRSVLRFVGVLLLATCSSESAAAEVVRAELGKDTAWTGEAVPLFVTLYSPGPFSGTASFELPVLPQTVFMRAGNPVVGSERIGDVSYLTQRHEFAVYSQRAGEIAIPAFRVRFSGKKTFTSAAEPLEGLTQELKFKSTRPPGTGHLGIVVAAKRMEVTQTWRPGTSGPVHTGDVIGRTISRRADGTTAMMFPPVSIDSLTGVRCYSTEPVVQDVTERGASRAERSETIKYQFERPGTFQLPGLSLQWWDSDAAELKSVTLPGKTVEVRSADVVQEPVAPTQAVAPVRLSRRSLVALLVTTALSIWLIGRTVGRLVAARAARRNDPAAQAGRQLLAACRTNAAAEAYAALQQWKRAVKFGETSPGELLSPDVVAEFEHEWNVLSRYVFAVGPVGRVDSAWCGRRLSEVFVRVRRGLSQSSSSKCMSADLPPLNPIGD